MFLYGFSAYILDYKWAINFSEDSKDDDFGGGILTPAFQGN